jgi:hypothetical protein
MSNARRIAEKAKPKAPRAPRAKKVKVDLSSLPDAIVDGKLTVPVKSKIVFERTINKKTAVHEGHIWGFDEATGDVSIWDETRGQFYGFNVSQAHLVNVKVSPGSGLP